MPEDNNGTGETGGQRASPYFAEIGSPTFAQLAPQRLSSNPRNARTHSKKQIKQIAESIKAFGFNNPILVDDAGEVIAGHGRLAAAIQMDLKEVPVVRLSHLSEAQKRAYVLADNKIALNAGWDTELEEPLVS